MVRGSHRHAGINETCSVHPPVLFFTFPTLQVQCIFFVLKAREPKDTGAKYDVYSSFLKRASPNTPVLNTMYVIRS